MCGEKLSNPPMNCSAMGSPPHVRGKVHHGVSVHALERITPACAGKSIFGHEMPASIGDHPRMCGEKYII